MLRSAERSALPKFDATEFLACLKKLIAVDRDWVPDSASSTLYVRPTMIGTEPTLGVMPSHSALLYIITGPVGPYYPTGFKPVSLYADPNYVRACIGGCGAYKMGANYGPTIYVQMEAVRSHNCQQVSRTPRQGEVSPLTIDTSPPSTGIQSAVLPQYTFQTDRQTQTDRQMG